MRRDKVLETINGLPPEFELEELIEKLIVMEKVEKGSTPLDRGGAQSREAVKQIVEKQRK